MIIIPAYMLGIGCENAFLRCNAKYALLIFPDRRFHQAAGLLDRGRAHDRQIRHTCQTRLKAGT
jgi:hypothetical protein